MRAISNQERMVRVPTNLDLRLRRIEKSSNEYHKEYGQIPTEKELADYMGKSLQEIRALRSYEHNTFSLDYIVENGEDKGSQILPPDNSTEDIHIQTERRDLIESLFEDSKLTLKEKDVLIKRNGLNNEGVYTLKEIGDLYGLTRERIRQIENRAIEKIKKKVKHLGLKMEDLI
jgi:RNA polymerase sigma factor (sigma-70 family)